AEDGIRYRNVTGVQTCALPISNPCKRRNKINISDGGFTNLRSDWYVGTSIINFITSFTRIGTRRRMGRCSIISSRICTERKARTIWKCSTNGSNYRDVDGDDCFVYYDVVT